MTVMPGSLDYLYYGGVLDCIPYAAYEMGPVSPSYINGSEYLDCAKRGCAFAGYGNDYDCYTPSATNYRAVEDGKDYSLKERIFGIGSNDGSAMDMETKLLGHDGKQMHHTFKNGFTGFCQSIAAIPNWVKGLISAGVISTTAAILIKRCLK